MSKPVKPDKPATPAPKDKPPKPQAKPPRPDPASNLPPTATPKQKHDARVKGFQPANKTARDQRRQDAVDTWEAGLP